VVSFPPATPTKTLYTLLSSPICTTCPAHLILLDFITRTILGEEYRLFTFKYLFSSLFACCGMFPLETLPPGDPIGGVVYLWMVLSPEQASRT